MVEFCLGLFVTFEIYLENFGLGFFGTTRSGCYFSRLSFGLYDVVTFCSFVLMTLGQNPYGFYF